MGMADPHLTLIRFPVRVPTVLAFSYSQICQVLMSRLRGFLMSCVCAHSCARVCVCVCVPGQ